MGNIARNMIKRITLAALALLLSCTEVIDIELDSTYTRLVVEGTVTTDSLRHGVRLSATSDYFSNEKAPAISGAEVKIEYDGNVVRLTENDTVPGFYQTPTAFRGEIGTTYRLQISGVDADGDGNTETYHAESTMPGGVRLDSVSLKYASTFFASGYEVYMYALDPPTRDWYNIKFWKNSDLLTDTLIKYNAQSDEFYNGSYLFYGLPIGFYNDEYPREILEEGDTVTLELNSITEFYYNFVVDAQLEIIGNIPLFSGPAANIRSNLDNGARGCFTAYSIERSSVLVTGIKNNR
jgi:hypothetical protein